MKLDNIFKLGHDMNEKKLIEKKVFFCFNSLHNVPPEY